MKATLRKRMRRFFIPSIVISLLIISIVVFPYSPIGVTRLRIKEVDVAYQFNEGRYLTMYAEGWYRERSLADVPVDPSARIKDFLLTDGFIFYSDDIPTGQAYCFTENYSPEYTDQTHR